MDNENTYESIIDDDGDDDDDDDAYYFFLFCTTNMTSSMFSWKPRSVINPGHTQHDITNQDCSHVIPPKKKYI